MIQSSLPISITQIVLAVAATCQPMLAAETLPLRGDAMQDHTERFALSDPLPIISADPCGPLAHAVSVALVSIQHAQPVSPNVVDSELNRLQGNWQFLTREDNGVVAPYEQWVLSISGTRWEEKYKDEVAFAGDIVIDKATPIAKALTVKSINGFPGGTATGFAIYEIDGDTLRCCIFCLSDDAFSTSATTIGPPDDSASTFRPTSFDTTGTTAIVTFTLRRRNI